MINGELMANIATVLALIVAIAEMRFNRVEQHNNHIRERKLATLDAYNRLQSEALDPLYIGYTPKQIETIVANHRKTEYAEEYRKLGTYVGRIEHFCTGIENEIYDVDTAYELASDFLDGSIRSRIRCMIDYKETVSEQENYRNTRIVFEKMRAKKKTVIEAQ